MIGMDKRQFINLSVDAQYGAYYGLERKNAELKKSLEKAVDYMTIHIQDCEKCIAKKLCDKTKHDPQGDGCYDIVLSYFLKGVQKNKKTIIDLYKHHEI